MGVANGVAASSGAGSPMGWNCPGTPAPWPSFRETSVTAPPWVMFVTNLDPGSCDFDLLTGLAMGSRRRRLVPVTLEAERPRPAAPPILTMDTPSSTKVSSRLLGWRVVWGPAALSWRFVPLAGGSVRSAGGAGELRRPAVAESSSSPAAEPAAVGPRGSFLVLGGSRGGGVSFAGPPAT